MNTKENKQTFINKANKELSQEEIRERLIDLGAALRDIREAQGVSLLEVSEDTKIQKHYISAIEEGTLELLPKGPYTRSFVRQYCNFLSAPDIWSIYDSITYDQKVKIPMAQSKIENTLTSSEPKIFKPSSLAWLYALIIISVVVAAWITWQYRGDIKDVATNPADGGTAVLTAQKQREALSLSHDAASVSKDVSYDLGWMDGKPYVPVVSKNITSKDRIVSSDTAARGESALKIVPTGTVWVKISRGSKTLFQGVIKQGDDKLYPSERNEPIKVRFGNPAKCAVVWCGAETSPVGSGKEPITKYYWPDGAVSSTSKK